MKMKEDMARVSLTELTTLRVTCKKCNRGSIEVPISNLMFAVTEDGKCCLCGQQHFTKSGRQFGTVHILTSLVNALTELQQYKDLEKELEIEFELKKSSVSK